MQLTLPSTRFGRGIGSWAGIATDLQGTRISAEAYANVRTYGLPSLEDRAFVQNLMQRVTEPGKMAGWLAPPERGINNLSISHEYVHL